MALFTSTSAMRAPSTAGAGMIAIKPSGVDYDRLRPADMVLVDLDGKRVEGRLRPSSDTPTHLVIYGAFGHVGGVAHTHSVHATSFAQAGLAIPVLGTTHCDYFHGPVPVTRELARREIAGSYAGNYLKKFIKRDYFLIFIR